MGVPRKNLLTALILQLFDPDTPLLPVESTYDFIKRKRDCRRPQYRDCLKGLRRRGVIEIVKKRQREFAKLTKKGSLKILLEKAEIKTVQPWDGKWRLAIFDIPERFNNSRDNFRHLLKQNGFVKLQASVFISPYPISRAALTYLKEVGLDHFVRILKIEELDNDSALKKKFGLK
ncbi:MAG: hypothetical protein P4L74_04750 [Candidatus Doudnabacteria bacterium]|nr:hypothetical protein [Candidatus Doudnabacteria bacterium]